MQNKCFCQLVYDFAKIILEKQAMSDMRFLIAHFKFDKNYSNYNKTASCYISLESTRFLLSNDI